MKLQNFELAGIIIDHEEEIASLKKALDISHSKNNELDKENEKFDRQALELLEKINSQKQEISEREKRIEELKNELHVVREDRNHYKNELSRNWTTVALAKYYCKRANEAEDFITNVIKL